MRVLRNRATTLRHVFYDEDEVAVDADGNVTVALVKADGSTLASATATNDPSEPGAYTYALAPQALLNDLTVTWTGTFDGVEQSEQDEAQIVGAHYCSLNAIREAPNTGSAFKFTTQQLREARDWFADTFEEHTGVAWVPRYARERLDGAYSSSLALSHYPVRSVYSLRTYTSATAYTSFTEDELADLELTEWGTITRRYLGYFSAGTGNLVAEYEHGHSSPPADIVRAAVVACREGLLTDKVGTRQFAIESNEGGLIRQATASENYPFGVPFVDAVANRYRRHRTPAVA